MRVATFRVLIRVAIVAAKLTLGLLFWLTTKALQHR
jgi:nitrogen fixation-related uncharacterized protein